MISIELSMRGMLRGFGLKLGKVTRRRLPERARELAAGNEMLTAMVTSMLRAHAGYRNAIYPGTRIARTGNNRRLK